MKRKKKKKLLDLNPHMRWTSMQGRWAPVTEPRSEPKQKNLTKHPRLLCFHYDLQPLFKLIMH